MQPAYKKMKFKTTVPLTEKQAKRILTLPINQFLQKKKLI